MSAAIINHPANHPAYYSAYLALREQRAVADPAWLNDLRAAAWERFDCQGFPIARRGNERWKYTNVRPIAQTEFGPSAAPLDGPPDLTGTADERLPYRTFPDAWLNLVFVDGHPVSLGQRRDGTGKAPAQDGPFTVGSLAEAGKSRDEGAVVRANLAGHAVYDDDSFVALNTAFLNDGAYVRLPDDYTEPVFVNITHLRYSEATVAYPRALIVAGRNTRLTVFESYIGSGGGAGDKDESLRYFTNAVTEIAVGEGAQLRHYRLLDESRAAFHVGTTRVTQAKDSSYNSGSFALGAALARHDLSTLLDGAGAYCSLNGLYLTDDRQHVDNLVSIDHAQPYGTSRLYYKGILDGRSRAVFGGTVLVREDAQKTDAQQTDKNLILSDRAEVDSKPSLLIYADDVKCGHGATAGHIDDDALFYMRSRGIDPETASQILIHAFASEIIESVPDAPVRDYLNRLFLNTVRGQVIPGNAPSVKTVSGTENPGSGRSLGGA